MSDVARLMEELESSARKLDKAADRLADVVREYEGGPDEDGVWQPGPQLRYENAVKVEAARIYTAATKAGEKAPPEAVRDAMAEEHVRVTEPELYADYHRLKSESSSLKTWMSAKKETISARQSVLSAEKALVNG